MADDFEMNSNQMYSIAGSLLDVIGDYKTNISKLISLVDEIKNSSSWKDEQVKSSFIMTCNSYISKYKTVVNEMEKYRNYLIKKTDCGVDLEHAFSSGGRL